MSRGLVMTLSLIIADAPYIYLALIVVRTASQFSSVMQPIERYSQVGAILAPEFPIFTNDFFEESTTNIRTSETMVKLDDIAFSIAAFINRLFVLEFGADKFIGNTAMMRGNLISRRRCRCSEKQRRAFRSGLHHACESLV
ncbi:hypothetical protein BPOR_0577g00040 [Botrytis porri]|uniref:Uncharacterized protein n=1 Tax=Botrytis porri TaxID=87229 RepID=A0A4Z1KI49_9HELO|nr:hypothetical protein BPOR_0577g00040 [Botrytis porri]